MRALVIAALCGCGGGGQSPPDPLADLRVEATAPASADANGPVEYTVTVTNDGPEDARGVVVTHSLTAGFIEVFQAEIQCVQTAGNGGRCEIPLLAVGASETFTILARAPGSGPFASTTQAFADGVDPDPINNSLILTTQLITRADLQLFVNTFTSTAAPGGLINYELFTVNNGPSNGESGVLLLQATGLTIDQVEVQGWTCTGSPDVTCTIPVFGVGNVHSLMISGTAPAQDPCSLMITVSSDTTEQFLGDNTATLVTSVGL